MHYKKYVVVVVAVALLISSCTMSYRQPGAATPIPTNPFVKPLSTDSNPMSQVEGFATGTAIAAMTAIAAGGPTATPTPTRPGGLTISTATPTLGTDDFFNSTATPTFGAGVATSTPIPPTLIVNRPASYTLQNGEHPYCIARRFNVDPDELLALSGLTRDQADSLVAGTVLKIPQSGFFPGNRALRSHPATYTVASSTETLYSIACLFGDVDPAAIAQANGIALGSPLTIGQSIKIP